MKTCPFCKVSVTGRLSRCPLCQNELTGEAVPAPFPAVTASRTHLFILRLLFFLSVAVTAVCIVVNLALPSTGAWSAFVVAGVACIWISLGISFLKRRDLLKNLSWQAFVLSALAILWDLCTRWRGWSVNFVVPCIFLVTMLLTPLLARLLKMPRSAYLVYFALVFGFGLIPAIFLWTGLVTIPLPSILSVGVSVVSLLALLVFGGRVMVEELHRRFHI